MQRSKGYLGRGLLSVGFVGLLAAAGNAHAALIPGIAQTWPDVTLGLGSLYYDHDASTTGEGLLRLVVSQATLGLAPGVTQSQLYNPQDVALSIEIDNATGAFLGGTVDISFGTSTTAPRFSWTGTITNFGFSADGKTFNASWQLQSDQYQNMTGAFSALHNGEMSGIGGGIILSNAGGWSAANFFHTATGAENFGLDWVMGSTNNNLAAYRAGMSSPIVVTSATTADVFVPLPAGVWLLGSALGGLVSLVRRARS